MVAARGDDRNARRGEDAPDRSQITVVQRLFGLDAAHHVAVQTHEVRTGFRGVGDQAPQDRVARMDIVHDPEVDALLSGVERPDRIGFVTENVASVTVAEDHADVAFVADDALLHDPISVGGVRRKPVHADAVQVPDRAAPLEGLVIFRAFAGVEMAPVVGGYLHPGCRVGRRGPHDGETRGGYLLYIGGLCDADRSLCAEPREAASQYDEEKQFFHGSSRFRFSEAFSGGSSEHGLRRRRCRAALPAAVSAAIRT